MLTVVDFVGVYQKARRTARNRLRTRDNEPQSITTQDDCTCKIKMPCLLVGISAFRNVPNKR